MSAPDKEALGWGDVWTWTAIDADTKLCLTYLRWRPWQRVGSQVHVTMPRLDSRPSHRSPRMATRPYLTGRRRMRSELNRLRATAEDLSAHRLPKRYTLQSGDVHRLRHESGDAEILTPSTSVRRYVERRISRISMGMRRFTRLTNAFSARRLRITRRIGSSFGFIYYNFVPRTSTLRVTPAMEAGISRSRLEQSRNCARCCLKPNPSPNGLTRKLSSKHLQKERARRKP